METIAKVKKRFGGRKAYLPKTKLVSKSINAGLQSPIERTTCFIKGRYTQRLGYGAMVYMAVVIEYFATKILEVAGNGARDTKKTTILVKHVEIVIRNNDEFVFGRFG